MQERHIHQPSRRSVLGGLGAIAGAGLVGGAATRAGAADQATSTGPSSLPGARAGTAPLAGLTYVVLSCFDFFPESTATGRAWGGFGMFATTPGNLWATCDLPPGAQLRQVEWYASNTSGTARNLTTRLFTTGSGVLDTILSSTTIADGVLPTSPVTTNLTAGPWPLGSRLVVGGYSVGSTTQINGVRLGFGNAPAGTVVLPRPVRVFDSRSSGNGARLGTGSVRTVTLTPQVPVGATGAIVNLMVLSTVGSGAVAACAAGTASGAGVLRWFASNQMLDNQVTVPLNAAAQMSLVVKSGSTHVVADVVGYLVAT